MAAYLSKVQGDGDRVVVYSISNAGTLPPTVGAINGFRDRMSILFISTADITYTTLDLFVWFTSHMLHESAVVLRTLFTACSIGSDLCMGGKVEHNGE